jgi:hypothetical protein
MLLLTLFKLASKPTIYFYCSGYRCAVIPGGIAEMYLVSEKREGLFLKKRQNTVKAAIQEGNKQQTIFFYIG